MSLRHFTPRGNRRRGISSKAQKILGATLALAIVFQSLTLFAHGNALHVTTIVAIFMGAIAMVLHAYMSFGTRYAFTYFCITLIFALVIEEIGVRTGWPFGDHAFDASLGVRIYNVPLVILVVWVMLAHPILIASRRVTQHWVFLYGGVIMMAWHLFVDSQLTIAHHITWIFTGRHVPFEPQLPISDPTGWLFAGIILIAILNTALPKERRKKGAEFVAVDIFLTWTLLFGIFYSAYFVKQLDRALISGAIYAVVLAPYFFSRWLGKPDR